MIIKRKSALWSVIENYCNRSREWETIKCIAVVSGLTGCGKTTLLTQYFKEKKHFYFSFAGLSENIAEQLFTQKVEKVTGKETTNWDDAFLALSKAYRYIIFDDISSISSYKRFANSFYENMNRDLNTRPLVFFIAGPTDNFNGLADVYKLIKVDYFSLPEIVKTVPKLSKIEMLGVSALSGGIPKIFNEYNPQTSFEDTLRAFLIPSSAFVNFMPYLLEKYFRKTEIYNTILYAIAKGNYKISDIGKFTGYAYNKCNNYVSALVSVGIIKTEKTKAKNGSEKIIYTLSSSYFMLWYLYIYQNRTEISQGDNEIKDGIVKAIIDKEIHLFHLQKAFAYANEKIHLDLWCSFRLDKKAEYAPKIIKKGNFSYDFDCILKKENKAVFIKVFEDKNENCKKDELDKIQKAVMLVNKYYDSHIFIFTKRRFSDYAAEQAPLDKCVSFVEVERLKY